MSNQAWECPRCGRMNAPFNPVCFCNPDNDLSFVEKDLLARVKKPLYTFDEVENYMKNSKCTTCGGHHGVWGGKAVECVNLKVEI